MTPKDPALNDLTESELALLTGGTKNPTKIMLTTTELRKLGRIVGAVSVGGRITTSGYRRVVAWRTNGLLSGEIEVKGKARREKKCRR